MGRKAARNMQSSNTNKTAIQCICWFYSHGICYDAWSYDHKMHNCVRQVLAILFKFTKLLFQKGPLCDKSAKNVKDFSEVAAV
jgi:hypothetical protein